MVIAVIGDAECSSRVASLAEEVGRRLAQAGAVLVCGGLGGVMEAACRGAKAAGGTTVGILPGMDPKEANFFVDVPIVTGMGQGRNVIVVASAQAIVAVSGGYGTLSEIAHALKLGIPVVGLETWRLDELPPGGHSGGVPITMARDPEEAVKRALQLARGRRR